jgi:hypothetical protein
MDRLLPSEVRLGANRPDLLRVGTGRLRSRWLPRHHPPQGRGRRGVRGAETPTPASKRGGCSATAQVATYPRRSRHPSLAGFRLMWSVPIWTSPSHETEDLRRGALVMRTRRAQAPDVWGSAGSGNVVRVVFELGGPVDRSLRRRGQLLVVAGALVGALIGTTLGLIAEDAQTSTAVAAAGPGRGAALAASPPTSHPPASRAAGAGDGNDSPGNQRAEPPGRPDKRDGNAQNDRAGGQDKPSKGKDKGK